MVTYALVDAAGAILRMHDEHPAKPEDPVGKNWRWLPENIPVYDDRYQRLQADTPVAPDATEVTFTVISRSAMDLVQRRKGELRTEILSRLAGYFLRPADITVSLGQLRADARAHETALNALTDPQAIVDYDLTSGWS